MGRKRGSSATVEETETQTAPREQDAWPTGRAQTIDGRRDAETAATREKFDKWLVSEIPVGEIERKNTSRIESPERKARLELMAESLRLVGQLQHACGWREDGKVRLIWGFGRLEATLLAKLPTLRVKMAPEVPDPQTVELLRGIENMMRIELSSAERAMQVSHMVDVCMKKGVPLDKAVAIAAEDYQIPARQAQDCVYIVERLAPKTRELMAGGKVTLGQARVLAKFGATATQEQYAKKIADDLEPPKSQYSANAGRGGRVVSVMEIEGWVQNEKHSLATVPWRVELPMKTGVEGCNACAGCTFNTATDVTLFDTSKDEAAKGCCLNPRGFEAKQRIVAREIEKATKDLAAQVKAKKLTKEEAAGAAAVRDAIPEYVKEGSAQRKARQELGLTDKPKPKQRDDGRKREFTPEEKAALAYAKEYTAWSSEAGKSIAAAINASPAAQVVWKLMQLDHHHYDLAQEYSPKTKKPEEKPLSRTDMAQLEAARKVVVGGDIKTLLRFGFKLDQWAGQRICNGNSGPEYVTQVAKAFGVEIAKPAPEWQSFFAGKNYPQPEARPVKKVKKSGGGVTPTMPTTTDEVFDEVALED